MPLHYLDPYGRPAALFLFSLQITCIDNKRWFTAFKIFKSFHNRNGSVKHNSVRCLKILESNGEAEKEGRT